MEPTSEGEPTTQSEPSGQSEPSAERPSAERRPPAWVERRFEFRPGTEHVPALVERLEAAPGRMAELLRRAGEGSAVRPAAGSWSIQEHAGHLTDLEPLMDRRLSEFLAGADELSPADMTNRATERADHNALPAGEVVERFRRARTALADRVRALETADWTRAALHPRLRQPMRVVDWLEFTVEHDEHHFRTIEARLP